MKFIELTFNDGRKTMVNFNLVYDFMQKPSSVIISMGNEYYFEVIETVEEIMYKLNNETK